METQQANFYIYGTCRSKEVGGLKSSYEGKLKLKWGSHKFQVDNFYEGVDPQLFYQNCLPISASFGVKICTTICLE